MTESKQAPTPGPWTIDPEGEVVVSIEGADGSVICDVHGASNDPLCYANARLIAAAPDLLAALELGIGAVGLLARKEDLEKYPQILAWIEQATIALSKSRGEGGK